MILFLDETYIKENTPTTFNVDAKDLYVHSVDAQNINFTDLLGSEFIADLLTKFDAGTLNTDETELVEIYIKPALVWRTLHLAIPFINFNLNNKGFTNYNDENSTNATYNEIQYLRNIVGDRAAWREGLLKKYLCKQSFPLYKDQDGLKKPQKGDTNDFDIIFY